eukprot:GGOE01018466.1.p1 GENE.GGOE01018466.1~~GGOE01018466.1.p1  ORF type:complete len:466 (-),score=91.48 GGOE01018466.1:259-1470(-)
MAHYWEQQPLLIKRRNPTYYTGLFSREELLRLVQKENFRDLKIKRFDANKGVKVDYPKPCTKAATLEKVWGQGWTVQVIQPQHKMEPLAGVVAALEEFFQCNVGCNAYLTPANTQGLAPHYDDIEAMILQLEGTKEWRMFRNPMALPRDYSRDFRPEEIGEPFFTQVVEPGDFLYFPRGVIHQARAVDSFSHHLTVSTYQRHTFYDLLNIALPEALEAAFREDIELRRGLPRDLFGCVGAAHRGHTSARQTALLAHLVKLVNRVQPHIDFHAAVDCMATDFVAQRLAPPDLSPATNPPPTSPTAVRLIRPSLMRMVLGRDNDSEELQVMLFHSFGNSRSDHMRGDCEPDPDCLRFPASHVAPIARLFQDFPHFTVVADLDLPSADRMTLVRELLTNGLLECEP